MNNRIKNLMIIALFLFPVVSTAKIIYESKDAQGNPVFSDQAQEDAKKIDLPPVSTFESIPAPSKIDKKPDEVFTYNILEIVEPEDQTTFHNNEGSVNFVIAVEPAMRPTDTLEILFNGTKKASSQKSTSFSFPLESIARGTYIVKVQIVDQRGRKLKTSAPIEIFIHKKSILR